MKHSFVFRGMILFSNVGIPLLAVPRSFGGSNHQSQRISGGTCDEIWPLPSASIKSKRALIFLASLKKCHAVRRHDDDDDDDDIGR